ncbi:MAG: hypothetical protein A3J75_00600 [Acidobacteria bacterium RBG_16_68_9]|nr:MAG: hypothetical protein A3J75_00600 [Acidobacteria bacterium RBG_16_68_9]
MAARARQGDVVLEGRLAGFVAAQDGLDALTVWLTASDEVRARRVAQREGRDWRAVLRINQDRHGSDAKRYREIYGFDLADRTIYDVVLNTDDQAPEALAAQLEERTRRRFGACRPRP